MSEIKNIADIPLLKLADLRRECRLLGLSITGNKSELCQKLTQYFLEKGPPSSIETNVTTFMSTTTQEHSCSIQTQSLNMITSSVTSHLPHLSKYKNDGAHLYAPDSYNISNNEVTSTLMASQEKSKLSSARQIVMTDDDLLEEKLLDSSNEDSPDNIDSVQIPNQSNGNESKSQIIKLNGITNVPESKRSVLREQKFQNSTNANSLDNKHHPKRMDEKMLNRAKRFGLPVKTTTTDTTQEPPKSNLEGPEAKKLRAKRFEINTTPETMDEKMKKSNRALRFGLK